MILIEQAYPFVFLLGIGSFVFITIMGGVGLRSFLSFIKDLTDQNARTMMFTAALNDKMNQQHSEIIQAIECLTGKIKAMAGSND